MSVRDAAVQVLREAKCPLHKGELTARILKQKLWTPTGTTPEATVEARICTEIIQNGDASVFVRVAPRTFGLRELGAKPIAGKPPAISKPVPEPKPKAPAKTYSFTDAAEKVLEQFGNKQPMHYRQITEKARDLKLIFTVGKTPDATMYAQILAEVRRHQKRGKQSRFVQHGRGHVGLSRWMGKGLAFEIEQHNRRVRQALHKRLLGMDPTEFEELIARLLAEIGFEDIEVTQRSKDGGIDVRGTLLVGDVIRTRMAVQVKRWQVSSRVQSQIVQQVRGSLGTHEQGLIITTSDFTAGARTEAARQNAVPVALMNGEQLVTLLSAYSIGVKRQSHSIIDLDEVTGGDVTGAADSASR
jgi:restriction system protein